MHRRLVALIAVVGFVVACPTSAQDAKKSAEPKKKATATAKAKTPQPKANTLTAEVEAPAPSPETTNVAVEVWLETGAVFTGVAMNGKVAEKTVGPGWTDVLGNPKDDVSSGIRLWYYRNLDGFVFLNHRYIDKVVVGKKLTESEMIALKTKVAEIRTGSKAPTKDGTAAKQGYASLDAGEKKLIDEFPPASGYSIERYEAVQRDFVTKGTKPTPDEDKWIEVYPDWVKSYRKYAGLPDPSGDVAKQKAPSKAAQAPKGAAPAKADAKSALPKPQAPGTKKLTDKKPAAPKGETEPSEPAPTDAPTGTSRGRG